MSREPTVFVLINTLTASHINDPVVRNFLISELKIDNFIPCYGEIYTYPALVREMSDLVVDENFFAGVSSSQYAMSKNGGVYINPCVLGLLSDKNTWVSILQDATHIARFKYIKIPYSVYSKINFGEDRTHYSEEEYESTDNLVKQIYREIIGHEGRVSKEMIRIYEILH